MKNIKFLVFSVLVLSFFTGCLNYNNKIVLSINEKQNDYELLVSEIEKKFRKCYSNPRSDWIVGTYVVREDLNNPRHTRLHLYVDPNQPNLMNTVATITIIKKNSGLNKIVITDREIIIVKSLKEWYENGMECNE